MNINIFLGLMIPFAGTALGCRDDIDGAAARVALNKKMVKVYCDREIDARVIEEVIRKRGYEAVLME